MNDPAAVPAGLRSTVLSEGLLLACQRYGDGNGLPAVLVHGGGVDSSFFIPTAQALARQRSVATYDRRGYGDSDDPADNDWSADAHARDLAAICDTTGKTRPVAIVAHSLGARTALRLVAARPDLVGALILVEPVGFETVGLPDPRAAEQRAISEVAASGHTPERSWRHFNSRPNPARLHPHPRRPN